MEAFLSDKKVHLRVRRPPQALNPTHCLHDAPDLNDPVINLPKRVNPVRPLDQGAYP
jgi:hypothetical protein